MHETRSRAGRQGSAAGEGFRPPRLHLDGARRERGAGAARRRRRRSRSPPIPAGIDAADVTIPVEGRRSSAATARCPRRAGRSRSCWSLPRSSASTTTSKDVCRRLAKAGLLRDRARPLYAQGRSHEDQGHGRDPADREQQVRHRARRRLRRDRRIRAGERQGRRRSGWRSPASAAADARRSSTRRPIRSSRPRSRGTARSVARRTSSRRARRWTASPRSRSRCWGSTAARTRAFRSSRSRNSSPR